MTAAHVRAGLTREHVIDAALAMVEREGADALTMRKLAEQLGVTTPTIYWHVGGRDEVLDAALARFAEQHEPQPPASRSPRERIVHLLRQMFEGGLEYPHITKLSTERVGVVHLALPWHRVVANEIASAGLRGEEAGAALHALLYTVGGLVHAALRPQEGDGTSPVTLLADAQPELQAMIRYRPSVYEVFDLVVPPLVTTLIPAAES
ncbi:TetR/AcrR family transcriptional regulator [Yinghuangia sp. YIM S09857]|uniref:TetR/AcrR family transcriptional regulator n=1 Tax=Yinghuangia sp. YIM S09857 TaxID=3436929 RepID=UPI003F539C07